MSTETVKPQTNNKNTGRLYPEDQAVVDEYLTTGTNRVDRGSFKTHSFNDLAHRRDSGVRRSQSIYWLSDYPFLIEHLTELGRTHNNKNISEQR